MPHLLSDGRTMPSSTVCSNYLSNALLCWIKTTVPLEGCWTSRADVMDNIVWWRITGAGEARKIGILPLLEPIRALVVTTRLIEDISGCGLHTH